MAEIKLKNKECQAILERLIRKYGSETMSGEIHARLILDKENKLLMECN